MDDHPKYRVLTQSWFLPQNIRRLEDRIRQIARAHVDRMADLGGECDFVTDVALTFPLQGSHGDPRGAGLRLAAHAQAHPGVVRGV